MTAREFQDKLLIEKGALNMACKFVPEYGVDMVSRISGFSREELLTNKLDMSSFSHRFLI